MNATTIKSEKKEKNPRVNECWNVEKFSVYFRKISKSFPFIQYRLYLHISVKEEKANIMMSGDALKFIFLLRKFKFYC